MDIVAPDVSRYVLEHCSPAEDDLLAELAEETRSRFEGSAGMQITADEGALLSLLVRLVGARSALEVGVFTGYSSLWVARALPDDGHLLALDVSEEWTSVARRYWERAGVADRVELRLGPAAEALRALPEDPTFDFAFVDADKEGYPTYYEEVVRRLRPGGLVVLDNVLRGGAVVDPAARTAADVAIRHVNDAVTADSRVDSVMLPVRDGVTVARRRP
jgi:caffeoyl-CoA O-methyltransferase